NSWAKCARRDAGHSHVYRCGKRSEPDRDAVIRVKKWGQPHRRRPADHAQPRSARSGACHPERHEIGACGMKLIIAGSTGRMGQTLLRLVEEDKKNFSLAGTLSDKSSDADVKAALIKVDALIDFTAPEASVSYAEQAAANGLIHIIGTTGFSAT